MYARIHNIIYLEKISKKSIWHKTCHQANLNIQCFHITQQTERQICGYVVQQLNRPSKLPIRTRYLGHVTGYQPIRDQHFLIRSVPDNHLDI